MVSEDSASKDGDAASREERIVQVIADVARRRSEGEKLPDAHITAEHADLMPELGEQLAALHRVEQGHQRAKINADVTQTRQPEDSANIDTQPALSPLSQPDSIAGYTIVHELHRGGQGVVYQAIQQSTKRKVAIKVMKEGPFGDAAEQARFQREIQILGQFQHPNIVAIHDSGIAAGSHYFVMDYIRGEPLDAYMASSKRSIDDTLQLFAKICDAVNAAHLRGIIHRDLKPGNIRIDTEGEPHILDFGLAKVTSGTDATQMTMTGMFLGSLPWASPEQAEGAPDQIDVRTDVYSLGVLLYQMLTGRFPYEVVGNMRDVLDNILKATPARPSTVRRQINDEVETIALKCLSKEKERRYQSAGELARDVQRYLKGEPIEAKRDSGWYVLKKSLRRHRAAVAVAAAFLLILGAGLATSLSLWRQAVRERDRAVAAEQSEGRQRRRAEDEAHNARLAEAEQRRLAQAEQRERKKAEAINRFVGKTLVSSDPHQGGEYGFLVADAMEQAIDLLDAGELRDQPEIETALRLKIAQILAGNARSELALRLAERALETDQALHPGDHPDVAASLSAVGNCLRLRGQLQEALVRLQAALEMRQRLFSGDHRDVAASLNDVGGCLEALGSPVYAITKFEAALGMYQRLYPGDHSKVAAALSNTASCMKSLGRLDEALTMFESALAMRQRLFEGDHPDIAASLNNLGGCLEALGRPSDALPMYEAALGMRQRLFPGDHPGVATSLNNVAECLQYLGRYEEALPKHETALEMWQRLFPGDHPDVAVGLNNLASALRSIGRLEEALPKYEAALEMRRRLFKGDHPAVARSLNNVARCLDSMGRSDEALPKFEAALEMYQRLIADDHSVVATCLNNVAACLDNLRRHAEAVPKYEAALEMFKRVLPPGQRVLTVVAGAMILQ